MGRIDPALIQQGESSNLKIIKFRGQTQIGGAGHVHKFVVYTDDSVEILEHNLLYIYVYVYVVFQYNINIDINI